MLRYQYQMLNAAPSFQDSLKALEADIQHANVLAASIPRGKGNKACLQMKLVYNKLAPIFLCVLGWMDCACPCLVISELELFHVIVFKVPTIGNSHGRKATIKEFYSKN
ncbi:hypothetical protein PIB30_045503 [Stylosanthes scabra]|uniref:Uncharacterized protein n=1 Tax=Stylosanthes scabra TaxID=79078 RepID=A0ABU6ZEX3_9FABA|nr:hypothetical protein [Stylosanthes scabra]